MILEKISLPENFENFNGEASLPPWRGTSDSIPSLHSQKIYGDSYKGMNLMKRSEAVKIIAFLEALSANPLTPTDEIVISRRRVFITSVKLAFVRLISLLKSLKRKRGRK